MAKKIVALSIYSEDGAWSEPVYFQGASGGIDTDKLPIASSETAGILKMYTALGGNTDGTMTQAAIQEAIRNVQVPVATSNAAGITKVYTSSGNNTDGTMTQAAIAAAINTALQNIPTTGNASSTTPGIAKLYNTLEGGNTDGAPTQNAVKTAVDGKLAGLVVGSNRIGGTADNGDVTIIAGSNVTITASQSGRTITISATDTNTEYNVASRTSNGLMSSADKQNLDTVYQGFSALPVANKSVTIGAADWTQGEAINGVAYYTTTLSVPGLADENPDIALDVSTGTLPTAAEREAFNSIDYAIATISGSTATITFFAAVKPMTDVHAVVKGYRAIS